MIETNLEEEIIRKIEEAEIIVTIEILEIEILKDQIETNMITSDEIINVVIEITIRNQ